MAAASSRLLRRRRRASATRGRRGSSTECRRWLASAALVWGRQRRDRAQSASRRGDHAEVGRLHMTKLLGRTVAPMIAALLLQLAFIAEPAAAAAGDLTADVVVPDQNPTQIAPSVAFDGHYLYYLGYGSPVLNRIDVPPAGGTQQATGRVQTPVTGAPSLMTLAYDAGRDAFWAVGGDGLSIYLLAKSGAATLKFTVDPVNDRPNFQTS